MNRAFQHVTITRAHFIFVALIAAASLWSIEARGAIPLQYQCSTEPNPQMSYCTAIVQGDWQYRLQNLPYGAAQQGPFETKGEALDSLAKLFVTPANTWCSTSVTSIDAPFYAPQFVGLNYQFKSDVHNQAVVYTTTSCNGTLQINTVLFELRTLTCPESPDPGVTYTMIYEAGVAGPYCAIPWSQVHKEKEDELCKGNPCLVMSGTKIQTETDYTGAGAFPLEFARTFNNKLALANALTNSNRHPWNPLGIGWTATYFQSLRYSATGSLESVFARRPSGRLVVFRKSGAAFVADNDVADRLDHLTDAGGNTVGWRYTTKADEVENYDASGRLTSIQSRSGLTHSIAYVGSSRYPSTVTHSHGHQISFNYTGDKLIKLTSITLPGGSQITYGFNANESVTSVAYPGSITRNYHYESTASGQANLLTGITDEGGLRFSTYGYNADGRVNATEHAGAVNKYSFSYNDGTGARTVTDPLNKQRTYGSAVVQGSRRTTSSSEVCQNCGEFKAMTHDTDGNPSISRDFNNVETRYTFDTARNLETSRTEAYGTPRARTIATQWHSTLRLPMQIDEPGKRTTVTRDTQGNVLTRTVLDTTTSESRTWTYTYNPFGKVLTVDGPRTDVSDVTTYTYYSCTTGYQCGQIETITNAVGHVTTYDTYNTHGQPLTITDPNGVVTTLAYDLRRRLTSRTVDTEQTLFAYWPTGLLKKVTQPDGSYLEYTYDNAHRLTAINDGEGNRISYTLDAMGNRTAENVYDPSNALMRTHTRTFNTLNQLWKEIGAAGSPNVTTTFGYDNNGNPTTINAPLGRNTTQQYDELNRLKQITDPLLGNTLYGYNALDQLISVTDPRGKVTSYTYNALDDLTQQVSPDTGTTTRTYDAAGNVLTSTDARNKTGTYTYDALNRVSTVSYTDQTISYTYDVGTNGKGRLTSMSDASGSTAWAYDAQGRVLSRTQAMGAVTKVVGYSYDSQGRPQTLTLPSGNTVTYGYANGKVSSLTLNGTTTVLSDVLYQPFGPTMGWTWGNATLAVREYDLDGKVTDIDSAGLRTYGYDDAFRITAITDASTPSLSQSYGYDLLDRITSATGTSLNQGWTYDANGNRLTQTGSQPSTYSVSSTSNRIATITGSLPRSYTYDGAGNAIGDGTATFGYNDAGRMVSVTKAGVTSTYALNGLGQRIKKSTGGSASVYFVYDEMGHLVGEYDSAGSLVQETIWFGDTPVVVLIPNVGSGVQLFYVHTDHLDTPRRISRPSDNAIVWRWDSDPFGTSTAIEDPDADGNLFVYRMRFPGQYFDAETGTHYNYFRDYDPQSGRYVQSDPIGLAGGLNTYGYVGGNPISLSDPLGLLPICETFQRDSTRRAWTEVSHRGIKLPGINMYPTGPGIGPEPSLRPPRKPPIGTQVRWEVWFVWLHFRRDINTSYEQFIQHMVSFCKDKITDECGREKEITLTPSYFDITHDPIKIGVTETDVYLFTEMVRRLGET